MRRVKLFIDCFTRRKAPSCQDLLCTWRNHHLEKCQSDDINSDFFPRSSNLLKMQHMCPYSLTNPAPHFPALLVTSPDKPFTLIRIAPLVFQHASHITRFYLFRLPLYP